jgi:hypothetical protein
MKDRYSETVERVVRKLEEERDLYNAVTFANIIDPSHGKNFEQHMRFSGFERDYVSRGGTKAPKRLQQSVSFSSLSPEDYESSMRRKGYHLRWVKKHSAYYERIDEDEKF